MVSIIVLSYNTKEIIKECLESIYKNLPQAYFQLIIVDNASVDGSVEMIKKEFKKIQLIENKTNVGFAKGVNIGARHAKGEFLVFLNSDALLRDDHIQQMADYLKENVNIGIMGGELLNTRGTTSRSYGNFFSLWETISFLFGGELYAKDTISNLEIQKIDWVSGGYMMIKRELFEKLKGFDEHFFMYIEDMELCYRAKKLGFETVFFPDAKALHIGQGSSNREFAIIQIYKGLLYFYKKQKNSFEYMVVKFMLIVKAVIAIIIGVVSGRKQLVSTYTKALAF